MPTVQRYNKEPDSLNPIPGARLNPNAANSEAFGGGQSLENVSTASRNTLFTAEKIMIQHRMAADETAAQDADITAGLLENKLRTDAVKMRGKDAIGAKDIIDTEWKKEIDKISGSLGNDRQRQMFLKKANARYVSLDQTIQTHTANETTRYQIETTDAHMQSELTTVTQNSNNQDLVARSMAIRESDFMRKAGILGYDETQIKQGLSEVRSETHQAVIEGMVANKDFESAKKYYEANKSNLVGEPAKNMENYIKSKERSSAELAAAEQERMFDENNHQLLKDEVSGNLTYSELVRRWNLGMIKDSDFKSAQERLLDPSKLEIRDAFKKYTSPSPETFNELRSMQISGQRTAPQISRLAADARSKGLLSDDDYKYIINAKNGQPNNANHERLNYKASYVRDFAKNYYSDDSISSESIVRDFYKRADAVNADGEAIDGVADEIIKEKIFARYPEISKLSDLPDITVTVDGKIDRMFGRKKTTNLKAKYKIVSLPPVYEKKKDQK